MSQLTVATVDAACDIPREAWGRLAPPGHPFLAADFFAILEKHQAAGPDWGWHPQHRVVRDGDGTVLGILPAYIKTHSHGDFVRDWSWAAAYRQLGHRYYPKLLSGLPHTPAAGPRLLVGENAYLRRPLIEAMKESVAAENLSSWHVALPSDEDFGMLAEAGLLISHDVQFQWRNRDYGDFDGFLAAFPSEKRRKIKAERRKVAESGLSVEVRHGDEVDAAEWPDLQRLYAATFDKYGNYAAFSADCFAELAATLGRRMVLFIAREARRPVAASICFRSPDTLYGRYWGCAGDWHSLHFELCFYQGIAYCLKQGLAVFEPGAGGEHKVARGFEPTLVRSCHWIADPRMRRLIGQHLEAQHHAILAYAEEAALHLPFRR